MSQAPEFEYTNIRIKLSSKWMK